MIWNSSNTWESIQNNRTHFLPEFKSNSTETFREILPHKTRFLTMLHIEFISHNVFSGSYYKIILHNFSEFISNNIDSSRVTNKQYCKIILFYINFYQTKLTFSELLSNNTDFFHKRCTRKYLFYELILNFYWLG